MAHRRSGGVLCALLGVCSVLLLSCTSDPEPSPTAATSPPTSPPVSTTAPAPVDRIGDEPVTEQALAALLTEVDTYRHWDACAFLDAGAATDVFGSGAVQRDIARCTFTGRDGAVAVDVGTPFPADEMADLPDVRAGGRELAKSAAATPGWCELYLPTSTDYAVRFQVTVDGSAGSAAACRAATDYVRADAARWTVPPPPAERLGRLDLQDPCATAAELGRVLHPRAQGVRLREEPSPSFCAVQWGTAAVTVSFFQAEYPRTPTEHDDAGDFSSLRVAGHAATAYTGDSMYPCMVSVRATRDSRYGLAQTIQVNSTENCTVAREAAGIVTRTALR